VFFLFTGCAESSEKESGPDVRSSFSKVLRSFDDSLNTLKRKLTEDQGASIIFTLISLSFVYGFIHSLGPGHGKILIASFFLKEKHPMRKSLLLSGIVSAVHSGSAIIISFLAFFVMKSLLRSFRGIQGIKTQGYFMMASGILITLIGVIFLLLKIFRRRSHMENRKGKTANFLIVGFSAGIVPCPVALGVMTFFLPNGLGHIGLLSVLFMSLGMFVLLTAVGLSTILVRKGLFKIADKTIHHVEKISSAVEYISIGFIILIGIFMIL